MKHIDKVHTSYKSRELDSDTLEAIRNADEEDLRVLLTAVLLEEKSEDNAVSANDICEALNISEAELSASIKYWRGAGLITLPKKKAAKEEKSEREEKPEPKKLDSAHRDGKLDKETLPTYTTEELTALMKRRKITHNFISEASRVYGKVFNQHEIEIIVRMIDYIGFSSECVLLLLSYYSKQKKTLRYIEKAALAFYDDGIMTAKELQHKLGAMERREEAEGQIRAMFGMTGRALTTKEKKYIVSWVENMSFSVEMIRLAYDKTVDITHEPSPAYANGILERWFADGIDTPEKVAQADEKRGEGKLGQVERSFDTNDFFEAALKRSYET